MSNGFFNVKFKYIFFNETFKKKNVQMNKCECHPVILFKAPSHFYVLNSVCVLALIFCGVERLL